MNIHQTRKVSSDDKKRKNTLSGKMPCIFREKKREVHEQGLHVFKIHNTFSFCFSKICVYTVEYA